MSRRKPYSSGIERTVNAATTLMPMLWFHGSGRCTSHLDAKYRLRLGNMLLGKARQVSFRGNGH